MTSDVRIHPENDMTVFRYDSTFEGLLTAVFDAYSRGVFPDMLLGKDQPEPLFTGDLHNVLTDPERSARVMRGLEKRLPARACNMLLHAWLSEEGGMDAALFRYMRRVFDTPHSVAADFTDDDTIRIHKSALKVAREGLFIIQFVRFQKTSDGTFFAAVSPRYNALPLSINHFRDRFADQKWFIYDMKRHYGYYYDMETVIEATLEDTAKISEGMLDEKIMAEDEKLFSSMWRTYFDALAIRERINPRLQRQHMPRRFWKYLTEKR